MLPVVGKRLFAIAACVACAQGGCQKEVPIDVRIRQPGAGDAHFGQLVLDVENGDNDAVVQVNGRTFRGAWTTSYFPALEMPLGPGKLKVKVTGPKVGARTIDFPFDRAPVDPSVRVEPALGTTVTAGACHGSICASKNLGADAQGTLRLLVHAAIGATVEMEGQKVVIDAPPTTSSNDGTAPSGILVVNLASRVPDFPLDRLAAGSEDETVELRVKVTTDTAKEYAFSVGALAFRAAVAAEARKVASGPVLPDGADTPARARAMLYLREQKLEFFGAPAKLRDVDLIAIDDIKPPQTLPDCGPYKSNGALAVTVRHLRVDEEVAVYERRTGKLRKKRLFPAPKGTCPDSVSVTGTDVHGFFSATDRPKDIVERPAPDVIDAWVKTAL